MPPNTPLRLMLLICVAFFASMATAHFLGLKWPVLFVYYDTPYYAYQDRIIAFTLVSYAILFFAAARERVVVPYALVSIWVTILGLSYINLSPELHEVLIPTQGTGIYWLITASFAGLAFVLTMLWHQERKTS